MRVVMDTCVLVGALFNSRAQQILSHWNAGRLTICYDRRIFDEYRRILTRIPPIRDQARSLLRTIAAGHHTERIDHAIELNIVIDDPADKKFLECLHASKANYLITQDEHLLSFHSRENACIVTPSGFLNQWNRGRQGQVEADP